MTMRTRGTGLWAVMGGALMALAACQQTDRNAPFRDDSLVDAPVTPTATDAAGDPQPLIEVADHFTVDGMVGQISGRPVFADTVFHGDDPIHDQLAALGRRHARPVFRLRSRELIVSRLRAMLLDSLILSEAERALSEAERGGLRMAMQRQREHLIRLYGQGSEATARAMILEQTGRTFDATMEDFRRRVVVQRHISATIEPRINVTRRDIERYFAQNIEQFRPPARRTLRLIQVPTQAEADDVASRLEAGESFASVADAVDNRFAVPGGLFEGAVGDEVFAFEALNTALLPLAQGERAGPITVNESFWFVYIEMLDAPTPRSLMDAQVEIERTLKFQQRQRETDRYYRRLLSGADQRVVDRMADALVEIAVSRYAVIDDAGTLSPNR